MITFEKLVKKFTKQTTRGEWAEAIQTLQELKNLYDAAAALELEAAVQTTAE
jgi:hypothetical protein